MLSTFHFDFGGPNSPVATRYTGVPLVTYNASQGYGWSSISGMSWKDENTGNPLLTDFQTGTNNTFLVDLANGYYDIMPTFGDAEASHDVSVYAQGNLLASNLQTAAGQYIHPTYRIQISNGQLALQLVAGKGSTFAINGLDINYGNGMYEHMDWNQLVAHMGANDQSPYVAGAEIHIPWAYFEPAKGTFVWTLLDNALATWAGVGKKVTLVIKTSPSGEDTDPNGGSPTPQWVFAEGAKSFTVVKDGLTQQIPVLWDPIFLKEYQTFLQQFAARYDGDPGLEYLIVGPGVFGSTRAIYPEDIKAYRAMGYTDQLWYQTNKTIMGYYRADFHMTHLSLGMSPFINDSANGPKYNEWNLAIYAAQQGFYIYYHDLLGTSAWINSRYPAFFASLGTTTKIALGMDNPTSGNETYETLYGDPVTCVQYAFGGVSGLPIINTYYVVFYLDDVSAGIPGNTHYQQEYNDALALALQLLQQQDKTW
jgi:hypothetical protein